MVHNNMYLCINKQTIHHVHIGSHMNVHRQKNSSSGQRI